MTTTPERNRAVRHSLVGLLGIYTLIEAPIEMASAESAPEFTAVLVAKTIWLLMIVGALVGNRIAERVLTAFCLISAIAVSITSIELASSYSHILLLLLADVTIKFFVFIFMAVPAVMNNRRIARASRPLISKTIPVHSPAQNLYQRPEASGEHS